MLYNQDWEKRDENPFTLRSLVAWLKTKNPFETYNYNDAYRCLLAQWAESVDPKAEPAGRGYHSFWYRVNGKDVDLFPFSKFASNRMGWESTFGNVLKGAEVQLAKQMEKEHAV